MATELQGLVQDFAWSLGVADSRRPVAINARSRKSYAPGIGPHTEAKTIRLVIAELLGLPNSGYRDRIALEVPYPLASRNKCDLCIGLEPNWEWVIEVKMLRLVGDNGKPNDNMLMHILSPYPLHRSAVTDCEKLLNSGLAGRKAIIIYGYDFHEWPMDVAIAAFEVLALERVCLSGRSEADAPDLVHPVHQRGREFGWEISPKTS